MTACGSAERCRCRELWDRDGIGVWRWSTTHRHQPPQHCPTAASPSRSAAYLHSAIQYSPLSNTRTHTWAHAASFHSYTQIVSFPTFSSTNKTRGNSRKWDKSHVLTVSGGHSFAKRIVNVWNSLPNCIVLSKLQPSDIQLINCIFPITVIIEFYVDVHSNSFKVSYCKLHVVFNILFTSFLVRGAHVTAEK